MQLSVVKSSCESERVNVCPQNVTQNTQCALSSITCSSYCFLLLLLRPPSFVHHLGLVGYHFTACFGSRNINNIIALCRRNKLNDKMSINKPFSKTFSNAAAFRSQRDQLLATSLCDSFIKYTHIP